MQRFIELPLDMIRVRGQVELAPVQSLRAVHQDLDGSGYAAGRIESQIGSMRNNGVLGQIGRCDGCVARPVSRLQQAAAKLVRPPQLAIWQQLLAGVEEHVIPIDVQYRQCYRSEEHTSELQSLRHLV